MASGNIIERGELRRVPVRAPRKKPKFLSRKSTGDVVFDFLNYSFLILFSLTILYPFWNTFLLSFSPIEETTSLGFNIWIKNWSLDAYKFALSRYGNVPIAYLNSIYKTVIGTLLAIIINLLASFPLSKKDLPGRNAMTLFIVITMFFSGGLIPTYLLMRNIGLIDTRWALIIPPLASGFSVIIMRNFLMTIDSAYEESAFMDGANYLQILLKIIVPLSKPVIAVIALWSAVAHWNAWFDAMIYLKRESLIVLQLLLRRLIQEINSLNEPIAEFREIEEVELPREGVKAAVTLLTIGPIIILYPFLQKYFVKGVFIGSLKG